MESTNIPDQLTYHEPEPDSRNERPDALFVAARIISMVFTPFMVPFVAFCLLFLFTYLRIMPWGYIMYDISNCRVKKNKSANMAKRNSG